MHLVQCCLNVLLASVMTSAVRGSVGVEALVQELIAFAKKHAHKLDGILFYKIDRAARNLFDYADLERLESEYKSFTKPLQIKPVLPINTRPQPMRLRSRLLVKLTSIWFFLSSGAYRGRTGNLCLAKAALSQLS